MKCSVEEGKKENRSLGMWTWNYKKFIENYQTEDVYMVNSLRGKLLGISILKISKLQNYIHSFNSFVLL